MTPPPARTQPRMQLRSAGLGLFGHRHRVTRFDRCSTCGQQVELAAYDAREWLTCGPVPLAPLHPWRVFDACPSCRTAWRIARPEYDAWVAEQVQSQLVQLAAHPDDHALRLQIAWQWYGFGRFRHALALLAVDWLGADPSPATRHLTGLLLDGIGQPREAADQLSLAVEQEPDQPAYRQALARYLSRRRATLALAEHHLVEARRLAPDDLPLALDLALLQCRRGNWPAALATWQDCARIDPGGAWQTRYARWLTRARRHAGGS